MIIEPKANNSINITTRVTGRTYEINDSDELGLCIVRADHLDISVGIADVKTMGIETIGKGFMVYLDGKETE